MSDDLKFDLPLAKPQRAPQPWAALVAAVCLGGGAALGVAALAGRLGPSSRAVQPAGSPTAIAAAGASTASLLSAEEHRALAERLERNQLFAQAAEAWRQAARLAPPQGADRAQRLYRIGKNLALARAHDEALRFLFAAEAAGAPDALKKRIDTMVLESLSALGLEDVRDYQALRQVSLTTQGTAAQPADELARIGNEPITERDLRAYVRGRIERQLAPQRAMLGPVAFRQAVDAAIKRRDAPQARRELLANYIRDELLYREALAYGTADQAGVKRLLVETRRDTLRSAFIDYYLRQTVHLDDAGIDDHYEANKERYVEPEAIRIEAIVVADEDKKAAVTDALAGGVDFEVVRGEHGLDETGIPDNWLTRDGVLPGVTDGRAALAHLFALDVWKVSDRWFEGADRSYRFRVVERRDPRQLPLGDCRVRVERDLRMRKQQQAIQTLQASLAAKYNVTVKQPTTQPKQVRLQP